MLKLTSTNLAFLMKLKKREFSFKEIKSQERFNRIISDIYNIVSQTFIGFNEMDIIGIVRHPLNKDVRALLVECNEQVVGFVIVQRISLNLGSKTVSIFKSMAAVYPEYRRKVKLSNYAIEVVLKHKICFPFREIYCFGLFIHPSVYYTFQRVCYEFYPHYKKETPEPYKQLVDHIAKKVGYVVLDADKLIGKTSSFIKSIESPEVRDYWYRHPSPHVEDFIERTGYRDGIGVFVLVPFTWKNIIMTILTEIRSNLVVKRRTASKKINTVTINK